MFVKFSLLFLTTVLFVLCKDVEDSNERTTEPPERESHEIQKINQETKNKDKETLTTIVIGTVCLVCFLILILLIIILVAQRRRVHRKRQSNPANKGGRSEEYGDCDWDHPVHDRGVTTDERYGPDKEREIVAEILSSKKLSKFSSRRAEKLNKESNIPPYPLKSTRVKQTKENPGHPVPLSVIDDKLLDKSCVPSAHATEKKETPQPNNIPTSAATKSIVFPKSKAAPRSELNLGNPSSAQFKSRKLINVSSRNDPKSGYFNKSNSGTFPSTPHTTDQASIGST